MTRFLKLVVVLAIISLVVATASARTFPNKREMLGGAHDLTGYAGFFKSATWSNYTTPTNAARVCSFCHSIHDTAQVQPDRTWLWTHAVPTSFPNLYTSPTMQTVEAPTAANESAKCLGCHDGTLAVSSGGFGMPGATSEYTSGTQLTTGGKLNLASNFVVTLDRTHPVSIVYNQTLAQAANLVVPASSTSVDAAGNIPLYNSNLECGTCHDAHINGRINNWNNKGSGILLRVFPTGAGIDAPANAAQGSGSFCLTCHL